MIEAGGVERALKTLEDRGLIYIGVAGAAQGQGARGLGAAAPDSVPRHPVRRRCRPAAQEVRRQLDLFRRRHRLSLRQVPARHADDDRRLGRRSCRLYQAHEGGGDGGHRRGGIPRRQGLPARAPAARRAAGQDVEAGRHLRHLARGGGGGRQERAALHHADAQERRAAGLRPRQGDGAVARQSGVLRPVRPCPGALGAAPGRRAVAGDRRDESPICIA